MTTTMLYIGFPAPFAGILGELPDGHPLWVLFDAVFGRYVKCCDLLDCPAFTIATAERLGLQVDPALPWFVEPPAPEANGDAAPEQIYRIHVRGIGVDGWDGSEAGTGSYENEEALKKIFAEFGEVKAATIRHRIEDGKNTSWALIELDSAEAVDKALAAEQVKVRSDAPPKSIRGVAACAQRVTAAVPCVVLCRPFWGLVGRGQLPHPPAPLPQRPAPLSHAALGWQAGSNPLRIERFDTEIAAASTGGMVAALKAHSGSIMGAAMASST